MGQWLEGTTQQTSENRLTVPFAFSMVHANAMGLSEIRPTNDLADNELFSKNVRNVSKSRP
jgi:hypothetical protein